MPLGAPALALLESMRPGDASEPLFPSSRDVESSQGDLKRLNADQAVVTDSVVSGKSSEGLSSAKLVATPTEGPMPIIDPHATESVPVAGGGTKAK